MRLDVRSTRFQEGEQLWKTVDEYYQTYWSGLDARVYAGNVLLDEIVALQYELQEAVLPVFSYASYTFTDALHGARRIQGMFTMNFKREGYLFELLRQLEKRTSVVGGNETNAPDESAFRLASRGNATVEDFTALVNKGTAHSERNKLTPESVQRLKDVSSAFEEAIWGRVEIPKALDPRTTPSRARFETAQDFDLHIHFGSREPLLNETDRRARKAAPDEDLVVATYTRLVGVHLTGVGRVLDDSGRPIMESYSFIAKDAL